MGGVIQPLIFNISAHLMWFDMVFIMCNTHIIKSISIIQGRRCRSGRAASAGPLFLAKYALRRVPFFSFRLTLLSGYHLLMQLSITLARVIN